MWSKFSELTGVSELQTGYVFVQPCIGPSCIKAHKYKNEEKAQRIAPPTIFFNDLFNYALSVTKTKKVWSEWQIGKDLEGCVVT
jgi:hypothetical protein